MKEQSCLQIERYWCVCLFCFHSLLLHCFSLKYATSSKCTLSHPAHCRNTSFYSFIAIKKHQYSAPQHVWYQQCFRRTLVLVWYYAAANNCQCVLDYTTLMYSQMIIAGIAIHLLRSNMKYRAQTSMHNNLMRCNLVQFKLSTSWFCY